MIKKKLLYASPFLPMKSGISDYSEKLVNVLKEKFDITLYIDDYKIANNLNDEFKVLKYGVSKVDYDSYDYIVYNIGNNEKYHKYIYKECLEHPGFVILHDFVIFYLFYGMYDDDDIIFYEKLFREGSNKDFFQVKCMIKEGYFDINKIANMPLNGEILRSNNKIIVHSLYSYNKVLETGFVKKENLFRVNHLAVGENFDNKNISKENLFKKFNIPKDAFLIASFGNIVPTKLNKYVCEAVQSISNKTNKNICYVLVGDGDCVNSYIDGNLIIKTGYTQLEDFEAFIEYADIIVNLRYPSMGETSGAMIRILERGKTCIINADAWFAELPKDAVYQVKRDNLEKELEEALLKLINDDTLKEKIGKNAKNYIEKEYNDSKILNDFCKILS